MPILSKRFRKLARQKRGQFILAVILFALAFALPSDNVWGFFGTLALVSVAIVLGVVPLVDFIEEDSSYVRKI